MIRKYHPLHLVVFRSMALRSHLLRLWHGVCFGLVRSSDYLFKHLHRFRRAKVAWLNLQHTPTQHGGLIVFFHVFNKPAPSRVASSNPHPAFNLQSNSMFRPCVIKSPFATDLLRKWMLNHGTRQTHAHKKLTCVCLCDRGWRIQLCRLARGDFARCAGDEFCEGHSHSLEGNVIHLWFARHFRLMRNRRG